MTGRRAILPPLVEITALFWLYLIAGAASIVVFGATVVVALVVAVLVVGHVAAAGVAETVARVARASRRT